MFQRANENDLPDLPGFQLLGLGATRQRATRSPPSPSGAVMGTILDAPPAEGIQTPERQEPKEEEPREKGETVSPDAHKKDVAAMTQSLLKVLGAKAKGKPTPKKEPAPKKNAAPKMAVKKEPAPKPALKAALKFTQPKAGAATVCIGKYSIRVDMPSKVWRVTGPKGTTRCASFKVDAKAGWEKVVAMVK